MIQSLGAWAAAIAIMAGAFGAHGAQGMAVEWLKTGSLYLLPHAIAVVILGQNGRLKGAVRLLLGGAALFAATLYAMALGAPRWLGAITPLGGVAMISGWIWLGLRLRKD